MQLSLFDDLFNDTPTLPQKPTRTIEPKKMFFVTSGLMIDKLKYGVLDKMPLTRAYENKEDVLSFLVKINYTRNEAEMLVNKAMENPNSWYDYQICDGIF